MHYPKTDLALVELRRLNDEQAIRFAWQDGATATMPWTLLQGYCPCALCRGHGGGEIEYIEPKRTLHGVDAAPVGNYAVTLAFEGGCNAGIFPFDFLREIAHRRGLLLSRADG